MGSLKIISVLLLTVASSAFADNCPPADILAPCTCIEQFSYITCQHIDEEFDIKAIFDKVAEHVDNSVTYDYLSIFNNLGLHEIPAHSFANIKVKDISIVGNENLIYISPYAFNGAVNTATNFTYKASDYKPYQGDTLFSLLNKFDQLEEIYISAKIASIPFNAFGRKQPTVRKVVINDYTGINSELVEEIRNWAFKGLVNLENLYVESHSYSDGVKLEESFLGGSDGITNLKRISFGRSSNMKKFDSKFKYLLDLVDSIEIGSVECGNGEIDWICQNFEEYEPKLLEFRCRNSVDTVKTYCSHYQNKKQ